jgi:hypothetical protein
MAWGDVVQWWASDEGWRVLTGAVIPGIAILLAGVIAALIGRGATKRLLAHHDRAALTSAVGAFVLAGRTAAEWHDLGEPAQRHTNQLVADAETRLRLLPVPGAALAASWATHQLESMKGHSSGFKFQAQQTLGDYRDSLIAWSQKPRTAKKLFGTDLERWRYETEVPPENAPETVADTQASPPSAVEQEQTDVAPSTPSTASTPSTPSTPVWDPSLAAALAAAPPPNASTAVSPVVVDDSEGAPQPMAAAAVRERITSSDHD